MLNVPAFRIWRIGFAAVLVIAISACATAPALVDGNEAKPTVHTVLVATTRQYDAEKERNFTGERSHKLNFAEVLVSVPPGHKPGELEEPRTLPGDPRTEFVAGLPNVFETEKIFLDRLNHALDKRPVGQKNVFVFVHGYNTSFVSATHRITQIIHDAGTNGVPLLFTWASHGRVVDYVYDMNSASAARDDFERTLRLAFRSKAEKVNVLAHSMGNWVAVETFRQIRASGTRFPDHKIGMIALASPDIDLDVFRAQMRRIGQPKKPFLIILSRDDKALGISSFIAGGQKRLGATDDIQELAALGATVIDMTDVKTSDSMNHGKFAELAAVGPGLADVLRTGLGPARPGGPAKDLGTIVALPLRVLNAPLSALQD